MIEPSNRDSWLPTDHDRVYYRHGGDRFERGEYLLAKFIAEHITGFDVVITMGPYRRHDVSWELHPDDRVIHLDCYSAGFKIHGEGVPYRPEHPATHRAEQLIHEIARGIAKAGVEFDLEPREGEP